jgi:citrate synthase
MNIKDKIAVQLPAWRERVYKLTKEHGDFKVCDVTVEQIYGGIRGVQIQVTDISYVDPMQGIRLRGYTIPEVLKLLPKAEGSEYPMAGGLYYLLMVDEMPTLQDALEVEGEWKARSSIPGYVYKVLRSMPPDTHPMTLFTQGILALQNSSAFVRQYQEGISRVDYWDSYLEDSLNLTAKVPVLAAFIYNLKYRDGIMDTPNPALDWSANFAHMIGKEDDLEYQELCRLFFVLHSDHEGANVSAHTSHLVSSALSDIYYSCAAAMTGLAGPLHGLANQECLRWLLNVNDYFGGFLPTPSQFETYAQELLKAGRIIPGYGHAVLRITDPRFTAQYEFARRFLPEDDLFKLVDLIYQVLPGVLQRHAKIKSTFPNVDAINGTLQYHYGVREYEFYTVLFGLSRILGLTAHAVWARALGKPIERPKSLTTRMLEEMVKVQ